MCPSEIIGLEISSGSELHSLAFHPAAASLFLLFLLPPMKQKGNFCVRYGSLSAILYMFKICAELTQ